MILFNIAFPEIADQWHPTKNINEPLETIKAYSNKRVWWICSLGHEWQAAIANRTFCHSNCPYCANKKAYEGNSVAGIFPDIAKEWCYDRNGKSLPENTLKHSSKKVWWRCQLGHEWLAKITDRTLNKSGCPYCTNRKVCYENSLASHELHKEFHFTKNDFLPENVLAGSHSKIWWLCSKDNSHEWFAEVNSRTSNRRGCPYCKSSINEKITGEALRILFPDTIIKEQFKIDCHIYSDGKIIRNYIRIDFILETNNKIIYIEYNGKQHYQALCFKSFKAEEKDDIEFHNRQVRDAWLRDYCNVNNIHLIEIDGRKYKGNQIMNYLREQLL